MVHWEDRRTVETGSRAGISAWRNVLCGIACMSCLPEIPVNNGLECLRYLGRNCVMDLSAGGTLSPSESDLTGPDGPYVPGGPVGQIGTLSPSTSSSEILVDPGGTLPSADRAEMLLPATPVGPVGRWGTLPLSDSDPAGSDGPYVTGGPVGQLGALSPSTFASAILVDPGGTLPSSYLAGMLLPAIPVSSVGIWGTLSSSDSDPAGQDGLHVTGGPPAGSAVVGYPQRPPPPAPSCVGVFLTLYFLTYVAIKRYVRLLWDMAWGCI